LKWGTGSLCDYSYWAREGSPEEFGDELFAALEYDKISPVSHTYIRPSLAQVKACQKILAIFRLFISRTRHILVLIMRLRRLLSVSFQNNQ
jgi:hypothetical protein